MDIREIGAGFWNIRGHFRLAGLVDLATQMSLVRKADGHFVALDSYTLSGEVLDEVMRLTDNGAKLDAVINLHPFHTLHCQAVAEIFPAARLYGTARHHRKWPQLAWQPQLAEGIDLPPLFPDLVFSVPRGIDLVTASEAVHFGSVLAFHPASGSLHVDDTFNYLDLPGPVGGALSTLLPGPRLSFHPTLSQALARRPGAASDFRHWALMLAEKWPEVANVCAAHSAVAPFAPGGFADAVRAALARVEGKLMKHQRKFG